MAYSTSSPFVLIVPAPMGASVPQLWAYSSADAEGTVDDSDYVTNGYDLGMRVGDAVFVWDTTNSYFHIKFVKTVTTNGAATLSAASLDITS